MRVTRFFIVVYLLCFAACGGSDADNILAHPASLAIDSSNSRMVVFDETAAAFSVVSTSANTVVAEQALIDKNHNTTLFDYLTAAPVDAAVIPSPASSTTSRVFVLGGFSDPTSGEHVDNRVVVFDYDGSTVSMPSFSPVKVEDDDATTDDDGNVLASIAADTTTGRFFVANKTLTELFIHSTSDGSEDASSPIDVTGTPGRMLIDPDLRRLFIASTSETAGEMVVTTLNLDNFADKTEITLDFPVRDLAVASTGIGTVLAVLPADDARIDIYQINTTSFDSVTAIGAGSVGNTSETSSTSDGSSQETVITGVLAQVELARASDDTLFAYATQSDGNLFVVEIAADLASFTSFALETGNTLQNGISSLKDTTTGDTTDIYAASPQSGLVIRADIGEDTSFSRIR